MVRASVESGTLWPSTTSAATSARKNGQGLLGETAVWGVPPKIVPARSSGMNINPKKHRMMKLTCLDARRMTFSKEIWQRRYLKMHTSFGGTQIQVNSIRVDQIRIN
jgi:hypothetical protein